MNTGYILNETLRGAVFPYDRKNRPPNNGQTTNNAQTDVDEC